jgi:hypothetical protein
MRYGVSMTGRRGYVIGLGIFVLSFVIAGWQLWQVYQRVQAFPRIDMPGSAAVQLPAGELTGYAEPAVGGSSLTELSARCAAQDARGDIALRRASADVSYDFGSVEGVSLVELDVATAGAVTLRCESATAFRLAIGPGIGGGIATAVACAFGGGLVGLVIVLYTRRRRRREPQP